MIQSKSKRKVYLSFGPVLAGEACSTRGRSYEVRPATWQCVDGEKSDCVAIVQFSGGASGRKPSAYVMAVEPEAVPILITGLQAYQMRAAS